MDDRQLTAILILLIPQLVKEIMANENILEDEAINNLYESKLYSLIEEEETKLWHLSPKALYVLYKQEKETGKIDFPEEA